MNRTWGYTKRPRNWKERLERFHRELEAEVESKLEPGPEKPLKPAVPAGSEKPVGSEKPLKFNVLQKPVVSARSTLNTRNDRTTDSSYSH